MTKVTFIIPSYNSSVTLPRTIESIFKQTVNDFEVIIVDSSDDQTAKKEVLAVSSDRVKVISLNKKTGPAEGRNIGASQARGELLCFVDSDVALAPDWLGKVLEAYADKCLAGCGSVDIHESQKGNDLAWAQLLLQFNESLPYNGRREIGMVPACNMFCDRKLFQEAGGFPNMRASEDVVLCIKLRKIYSIWFVPQARAYHIFRESKQAYYNNQVMLGKYILFYRRDFVKSWYSQGLWPLLFLPAFVAIKLYRISSRIQKNAAVYRQKYWNVLPLFLVGVYFWTKGFALAVFEKGEVV